MWDLLLDSDIILLIGDNENIVKRWKTFCLRMSI